MNERDSGTTYLDGWSMLLYLCLVFLGWLSIYSASHGGDTFELDFSTNYGKQIIWIGISLFLGGAIFLIDTRFFDVFAYVFYVLTIALLVLVLVFGTEVNGAKAWFEIGGFRLQPAEFAKFGTALALAKYLGDIDSNIRNFRQQVISFILLGIPAVLIVVQGDAGSALVYASLTLMFYREGMSGLFLIIGIGVVVLFILTIAYGTTSVMIGAVILALIIFAFTYTRKGIIRYLIGALVVCLALSISVEAAFEKVLQPHQQIRLEVMLGLKEDPQGVGYNVTQSKIAIGSGGFFGKGFLNGTQTKGDFVPEQHTDFIFSTVGEEFGWLGSLLVIGLFTTLFIRISFLAERQRSKFNRVYAYSVLCILLFHFAINIGMTVNIAPVIGIPLPFFSYGGSSMISFTLLLFLLLRLDANRYNELDSVHN